MFCICIMLNKDGEQKKNWGQIGIFCVEFGKNILYGIGNGAEFGPQNRMIESPDS